MPVSPVCLVADGLGPFVITDNGVDVGTGDTISIKLQNATGVTQWLLEIIGTDELSTAPPLTNVDPFHVVTSPTTVVTFTFPNARGRSLRFRSTVNGPGGPAVATFGIYSVTVLGRRVGSVGEQRETNLDFGWILLLNPIIRQGAGILFYDDTLALPATGSATIQGAIDYIKTHNTTGPAGGDLGGFFPNPTVFKIRTAPLGPSVAAPGAGTFLGWDGANWSALPAPGGGPPSGAAGGSLGGTYPNPIVVQIDGTAGTAPITADLLQWINTAIAGMGQDVPPNGATPTTDFTLTSQPPNPGGGLFTGRPGNLNFVIPLPVGGASDGQINFLVGVSTPLQLTSDAAVGSKFQIGSGGPKLIGVPVLPPVGSVPEGTLALITNPADANGGYIAHNGAWTGLGTPTLDGDVTGPGNANVVSAIKAVPSPTLGSEFQGASLTVDNVPQWPRPFVLAWDTVDSVVWVGDETIFALFRFNPSGAYGLHNPQKYLYTSPAVNGIFSMVMDATYIYVVCQMSFFAVPGVDPNVFIIDRASKTIVGRISTASTSGIGLVTDGAGNLFILQTSFDIEKYNVAAVVGAYPALGTLVATVPGTSLFLGEGDICSDGTFIYSTSQTGGGSIFQIDPVLATITQTLAATPAIGLAVGGGWLWAASGAAVLQINTGTMTVNNTVPTSIGPLSGGIVYDVFHDTVWVTENFSSRIWIVDAIGLGIPVQATGVYIGDSPNGPRCLAYQSTGSFLTNHKVWKTTPQTAFPGVAGFQGVRRYNGGVPYNEEVRFVGPLSLKYITPPPLNITQQIGASDSPWTVTFPTGVGSLPQPKYVLFVDTTFFVPGPVTVNIPGFVAAGSEIIIKDATGQCFLNNITIVPGAGTIDGAPTYVMSNPYESVTLVFSGSYWSIV